MRRRHGHVLFAIAALAFAGHLLWHASHWQQARAISADVASERARPGTAPDRPEVQFLRAAVHGAGGDYFAAIEAYKPLIGRPGKHPLADAAAFNLGNLHLREAHRLASPERALPALELAKQQYRDLLRARPQHWPARYNLELALRLAPETQPEPEAGRPDTAFERRISGMRDFRVVLP